MDAELTKPLKWQRLIIEELFLFYLGTHYLLIIKNKLLFNNLSGLTITIKQEIKYWF